MIDMTQPGWARLGHGARRIGKFHVGLSFFYDLREDEACSIFERMVVLAVTQPVNSTSAEYTAICPAFRLIEGGELIPTYEAWFFAGSVRPYWVELNPDAPRERRVFADRIPAPPAPALGRMMTTVDGALRYSSGGHVWDWMPHLEAWVRRGDPIPAPSPARQQQFWGDICRFALHLGPPIVIGGAIGALPFVFGIVRAIGRWWGY